MTSEELVAGFKNALDRGSTQEDAKKSFLNAGYTQNEVDKAASEFNQSTSSLIQSQPSTNENSQTNQPLTQTTVPNANPSSTSNPKKSVSKKKIIILSVILIVLLIGLGVSAYFLLSK